MIPASRLASFLMLCCLCSLSTIAQLPDPIIQKIDKLFSNDNKEAPGFTVGIVRNDSLIFSRGYGMANIEYSVPNTPATIFHMASISKQFTAYCILLLEQQGKLKLTDDIRQHLPWFPDLKHKITILHLLNHTSGIRDQWDLSLISGKRNDDVITQDLLISLISRQQALNFVPGERFSYSNSNYMLLAEIVKKVSGRSFRSFADEAIFRPLGMRSTHVHDDHTEIVPNRAYSYRPQGGGYANAVLSFANAGATSLFTNIPDLAKWVMNFYNTTVGDANTIRTFTTNGILNNGSTIPYAAGIIADEYKGKKRFTHSGGDAGYRTNMAVFPNEKMGFIIFSNVATTNPVVKTNELVDILLEPLPTTVTPKRIIDSSLTRIIDTAALRTFMGNYIAQDGVRFSYALKGDKIYWTSPTTTHLLARTGDTLVSMNNTDIRFFFRNTASGPVVDQYAPDISRKLQKIIPPPTDPAQLRKELEAYTGTFYSEETDSKCSFTLEGSTLQITNGLLTRNRTPLEYIQKDQFNGGGLFLNFKRDQRNKIIGVELNTNRSRDLLFRKVQ